MQPNASHVLIPTVVAPESTPAAMPYVGNADFGTRNAAAKALASAAGIRLPSTRVAEGDSLLPVGVEAQRRLECEIADLPDLADGLTALRARIAAEDAKDSQVSLQRIRMEPTRGALVPEPGTPVALGYTHTGLDHLLAFVKPSEVHGAGFGSTLLALPPAIRAQAINHFAERSTQLPAGAVVRSILDPRSGRRVIRAITSERHSLTTGDDGAIADAVQAAVPAGAKIRVTRSLDRTDLEVIWPALQRELRVGDLALISVGVVNSETKHGSLRVEPRLLRVLCFNFTTAWSTGADEEIAIRHVGDLATKLPAAFARALRVVEPFVRAFGDAYAKPLPEFAPTRGEVLERCRRALELPAKLIESAAGLWDADGQQGAGDTLAGLVNALTRASQAQTMAGAAEVEREAGRLISQGWTALA